MEAERAAILSPELLTVPSGLLRGCDSQWIITKMGISEQKKVQHGRWQRSMEDWLNYFTSVPVQHCDFRILSYNGLELFFPWWFSLIPSLHTWYQEAEEFGRTQTLFALIGVNEKSVWMCSLCCSSRAGFGLHWVESWEVLTSDLFQHLWPDKNVIQCLPKHCLHAEYGIFQCMRIINLVKCRSSYMKDRKGGCTGRALRNITHVCCEYVSCWAFKDMQV